MNWEQIINSASVYWLLLLIVFILMYAVFIKKSSKK